MSEESADSVIEEGSEESAFDMESAQETISDDIFGKQEESEELNLDQEDEEKETEKEEKEEPEKEKAEKPEEKGEKEEKPAKNAPNSWKKEMREFYSSADPVLQDYINQREQQMHEGLETDRNDANLGRTMRDMMTPFNAFFQERGIQGPQAVQYLLNTHKALTSGTVEQKQAVLAQLSQSYGITKPKEGDNPQLTSLVQRLGAIEQNLNKSQRRTLQETSTRIEAEVEAFAKDHPLFDDLQDEITKYINAGYELEDAYKMAERSSDGFINSEVERLMKERDDKAKIQDEDELEKARKAKSVNVKGRNARKSPTADKGKMFDDMHDMYRDIKSRN